ncbi:hypothetical protein ACKI14_45020 [Streptomyces turgidiscabies]|uniref:hypothetical protein n=1 Tax=Streptomyces turgidiscabies TaxID=85558 RepID=UPI0038F7B1D6
MASVVVGVLVLVLAMQGGMGVLNAAGGAFLAYVAAMVVAVCKFPLHPGRVVVSSVKGSLVTGVVTAIVVIGIVKAFRGLL